MIVNFFGVVFLLSCFNYVLRKIVDDNEEEYGSVVVSTMRRNFYVDDCFRLVSIEIKVKE